MMHTEKWSRGLCIWIYTLDSGPQNRHRGANRDDEFRRKTTLYQSLRKRTGRVAPSAGEALELSRSCSFASLGPENLTEYAIRRTKAGEAESIAGLFGIWRSGKHWDVKVPTEFWDVAQLVSAVGSDPKGCWFESSRPSYETIRRTYSILPQEEWMVAEPKSKALSRSLERPQQADRGEAKSRTLVKEIGKENWQVHHRGAAERNRSKEDSFIVNGVVS